MVYPDSNLKSKQGRKKSDCGTPEPEIEFNMSVVKQEPCDEVPEDAAIPEISFEITADGIKSERVSSDEIGELDKAIQVEIGYGKRCSRCWVPTRDAATSPARELSTQTNYSSTKDWLIPSELSTNSTGAMKKETESCDVKLEMPETPNNGTNEDFSENSEDCDSSEPPKKTRKRGNPQEITPTSQQIQPRCECIRRHFHCRELSEEKRQQLFDYFWSLETWGDRKAFVCKYVDAEAVKRRRDKSNTSRRKLSLHYFFPVNGKRETVCKKFFINTLCIRPLVVLNWAESVLIY